MKLNDMHNKVIAVAKKNPPSNHVPYAFEQRVMHRLASVTPHNHWALWGGPLWRAAVSCVAITVLCGVWSLTAAPHTESQESFSQAFESAVYAPPAQQDASW